MTRIICAEDCGNSPRKLLLRDIDSTLPQGNESIVLKDLTDDIAWEWVGAAPLRGREAVTRSLGRMNQEPRQEVAIDHILTHGSAGSVKGTLRLTNGRTYGFCDVFEFSGARIKRITSCELHK